MDNSKANAYYFLPELFLRAPQFSFHSYDLLRLPEVLMQPDFQDAIWLASPAFFRVLMKKGFEYDRLSEKEQFSIRKYYNRICFRPTPFGSFASFTLLNWDGKSPVFLAERVENKLHLLPDLQVLSALSRSDKLKPASDLLMVNPCLYRTHKTYRYLQGKVLDGKTFRFRLKALDAVKFHRELLALFKAGPRFADSVLEWIGEHGACSAAEAAEYLDFLLEEQVLMDRRQGALIGLSGKAEQISVDNFWMNPGPLSLQGTFELQRATAELKAGLPSGAALPEDSHIFYAALERPHKAGAPPLADQQELNDAMGLLRRLSVVSQPEDLLRFIKAFRERFDRQKIPLLLALDPDAGISYGDLNMGSREPSVLENVNFSQHSLEDNALRWTPVHRLLFRLWIGDKLRDPWSPLLITDDDVENLGSGKIKPAIFPQTLALVYRRTVENILIEHADGVSATSLIGRFSCFNDDVHRLCRKLAKREIEANPDVIFADLGQLSDTHVDNINRRRSIYSYEIPLNVFSNLPAEEQVRPDDLLVSVQGNELILESSSLDKRVIPRLSTAYNFRHTHLSIFRLLCDLQFQGLSAGLSLDLEVLFPGLEYYPRVIYRTTILSLASWNFTGVQMVALTGLEAGELMAALQRFRQDHHLPRHVSLGSYDQQLVFDLADQSDAQFFIQCLKGLKNAKIREYLLPDRSVRSGNKPLAGQFVAFLTHDEKVYHPVPRQQYGSVDGQRNFMAGTNWLYLKIYCTPRLADAILDEVVRPFVAVNGRSVEKWFFIRYHDKGYHLRLRMHAAENNLGSLLVALQKRMTARGYDQLISDYQLDTYRQEIERYGADLMPFVEDVFYSGSGLVVWFIRQKVKLGNWTEFELALLTADLMIRHFLPETASRLTFIRQVAKQFFVEFGGSKQLKMDVDLKYRELRETVERALRNTIIARKASPLIKSLKRLLTAMNEKHDAKLQVMVGDLVHMQLNRTFSSDQRKQEFLVYYCLEKHAIAELARKRS